MQQRKTKTWVPLHAGLTVSEALAEILCHDFQVMLSWEDQARTWDNTEGVHQMRVSSRRMRAALSAFRTAVPKTVSQPWSDELRWIANQLGPARDLDVFIDEGLASVRHRLPLSGGERLEALARQRRALAYESVRAMLDSERYLAFKLDFPDWFGQAAWTRAELSPRERHRLARSIAHYARKRLDRLMHHVLEAGLGVDRDDPRQMHLLRIECKKLRYAAEFFAPIVPGLDDFIDRLKGLQDLLGALNDVAVTSELLADLLAEESDREVIRYAGALIGWRTHQAYDLLKDFEERWREFRRSERPW
ncbi:CHAD domain-containing protein [Thermochromatium tepidum]|uniref:CHAD domain-containing protein n=1 Tax=Thermochromatium tepidum ATCC 43061 TaxID=316276 RepID=A0A6I6E2V2_THETI|nr:CHAD domain-containing protein [Thermochromatium tepidum]QGU33275.1 CHAD domain-containing protein [Thermochromatium tepidum ATCC 43061]